MLRDKLRQIIKDITDADSDISYSPEGRGDLSSNIAFKLAAGLKIGSPMDVALELVEKLKNNEEVKKYFFDIKAEEPGFVNFIYLDDYIRGQVSEIIKHNVTYAENNYGSGQTVSIEFVSANPTGPLTLGNGRSAAYGDALGRILTASGYSVHREYYINDMGRQVEILGESVARRYLQLENRETDYPEEMYQGEYITDLARKMKDRGLYHGDINNFSDLQKEAKQFAVEEVILSLKKTLTRFGVEYDQWFNEKQLHEKGLVESVLNELKGAGLTYDKDGALWFKGTELGLDKDAVIIKSTGQKSYLLADFAYAQNKISRGFEKNITILGADHHGDVPRIKAGVKALGLDENKFEFPVHQLVTLKKEGEALRMSKRKGTFVTMNDLLDEVPLDSVKFFFLLKSLNEHIDFDIALAKEQSSKNPIYYIQYAHARASSIISKAADLGLKATGEENMKYLENEYEKDLIKEMLKLPELIRDISENYQVHNLAHWLLGLAGKFHKFYDTSPALAAESPIKEARLALALASKIIISKALTLLGIQAPEKM